MYSMSPCIINSQHAPTNNVCTDVFPTYNPS